MSPDDVSIAIEERGQTELLKAQLAAAIARAEKAESALAELVENVKDWIDEELIVWPDFNQELLGTKKSKNPIT